MRIHVLTISPEVAPFSGGESELAETAAQLPQALKAHGLDVTVVAPLYTDISPRRHHLARRLTKLSVPVGGSEQQVEIYEGKLGASGVKAIFLGHAGSFPQHCDGAAQDGDHRRWYLLAQATLQLLVEHQIRADVLHALGWQTAFLPLLLRQLPRDHPYAHAKVVFTVFDPAQHGCFPPAGLDELRLDDGLLHPEGIALNGQVSLLKTGVRLSDAITLPGPTTAAQVQQEAFGASLQQLYASRSEHIIGVLGGLDYDAWGPGNRRRVPRPYDGDTLDEKTAGKHALLAELGLPVQPDLPLLTMFGPLDEASGIDLLLEAADEWLAYELRIALVGRADQIRAGRIRDLSAKHPERIVHLDHDVAPDLPRILAGTDIILLAPHGLTSTSLSLKALSFGAVPVAHAIGVLKDTIVDFDPISQTGTGFLFDDLSVSALLGGMRRALSCHRVPGHWHRVQQNAMQQRFSWSRAAARYAQLFAQTAGKMPH